MNPPSGPTRRSWPLALGIALSAGLAAGVLIAGAAPWTTSKPGGIQVIETEVAGISVERTTTTAAPAADVPTTAAPATAAPTTAAPAPAPTSTPPSTAATGAPIPTAEQLVAPPTDSSPDAVRAEVLAAIPFPWQDVLEGWTIEFLPARKGYRGSTFPSRRLIQIYLRSELTVADYVHVTAHEIGHALDVTLLDDADHQRWNLARGRDADATWWVDSGADDFASGAGDWAECFAWSQLPAGRFYSEVAGRPTEEQIGVMADILSS